MMPDYQQLLGLNEDKLMREKYPQQQSQSPWPWPIPVATPASETPPPQPAPQMPQDLATALGLLAAAGSDQVPQPMPVSQPAPPVGMAGLFVQEDPWSKPGSPISYTDEQLRRLGISPQKLLGGV